MSDKSKRVCPVERAGGLYNKIRRWLQNPQKILRPYIEEGMTVLDLGCGPGFFSNIRSEVTQDCGSGCPVLPINRLRRTKGG